MGPTDYTTGLERTEVKARAWLPFLCLLHPHPTWTNDKVKILDGKVSASQLFDEESGSKFSLGHNGT